MQELTQQGIAAMKAGDRAAARKLLAAAIDRDENDATAWLWLAATLNHDADRVTCLHQVLKLDPQNQAARRGLSEILNRTTPQPPRPAPAVEQKVAAPQEVAQEQAAQRESTPQPPVLPPAAESAATGGATIYDGASAAGTTGAAGTTVAAGTTGAAGAFWQRRARHEAQAAADQPAQVIFNARPSQVPALLCFWLFLIGAGLVGSLLGRLPGMEEPIPLLPGSPAISMTLNTLAGFGLAILLELVVIYVVIRNFVARYQLNSRQLIVRFRGRRARLDLSDLISAECRQTGLQKITGTGDVDIEATVNGQLAHLRLRDITDPQHRAEQIQSLISHS